jgi:hypothetical protein
MSVLVARKIALLRLQKLNDPPSMNELSEINTTMELVTRENDKLVLSFCIALK